MEDIWNNQFIINFGDNDINKELIINIIKQVSNDPNWAPKNKNYIKKSLSGINKHIYNRFISKMLGLNQTLLTFESFNTDIFTNEENNEIIQKDLNDKGYYLCSSILDTNTCDNIKNNLNDLKFKPQRSSKKILGKNLIDKQVSIDNSTTFWITSQKKIFNIPEIKKLAHDPYLLNIVQSYLGCKPILCQTNVWYSCENKKNIESTQQFHQDFDDINFLKVFIYLSDVGKKNGPHRYIEGSINNIKKPERYSIHRRLTNEFVEKNYNDKIKVFTGGKGTILIENTNGFHAGSSVKKGNRLILQLQYASTLYPLSDGAEFCHSFD